MNAQLVNSVVFLLSLAVSHALAQSCTPDVPKETCEVSSAYFLLTYMKNAPQIIIASPNAFKHKGDLLKSEYTWEDVERNLRLNKRSSAPFMYDHSNEIIFIRSSDDSCPSTIYISTDAFRPYKVVMMQDGRTVDLEKSGHLDGFDWKAVQPVAAYVKGYIAGCREGILRAPCWNVLR